MGAIANTGTGESLTVLRLHKTRQVEPTSCSSSFLAMVAFTLVPLCPLPYKDPVFVLKGAFCSCEEAKASCARTRGKDAPPHLQLRPPPQPTVAHSWQTIMRPSPPAHPVSGPPFGRHPLPQQNDKGRFGASFARVALPGLLGERMQNGCH